MFLQVLYKLNLLSFMNFSLWTLKYFVIIKKGEIIAPRIDFDDHKLFEETTNEFSILEKYFSIISGSPKCWVRKASSRVLKLKFLQFEKVFKASWGYRINLNLFKSIWKYSDKFRTLNIWKIRLVQNGMTHLGHPLSLGSWHASFWLMACSGMIHLGWPM